MKAKNILLLSASFLLLASCGENQAPEITIEEAQTISRNAKAKYEADEVTVPSDFWMKSVMATTTAKDGTQGVSVEITSALSQKYFHLKMEAEGVEDAGSMEQYVYVKDGTYVLAAAIGEQKLYQEVTVGADALFEQTVAEFQTEFNGEELAASFMDSLAETIDSLIGMMPAEVEGELSYPEGMTSWAATCRSSGEGNLSVEASIQGNIDGVAFDSSLSLAIDNYFPQRLASNETYGEESATTSLEFAWGNVDLVYPNAADFQA